MGVGRYEKTFRDPSSEFLGDYFEPGFLSVIFFILMGLSFVTLIYSFMK